MKLGTLVALVVLGTLGNLEALETLEVLENREVLDDIATPATEFPLFSATDGERTAFRLVIADPEPALRAESGHLFNVGYQLAVVASAPDGVAESFATPLLAPEENAPAPGFLTLRFVVERVWPDGTRFVAAVFDRDGNALEP